MFWWCTVQTNPCHFPETLSVRQKQTQCGALWLCEEIVQLWRLACLNPELRPILSHANNKPLSPSPSSSSSSFGHGLFSSSNCKSYSGNSWLLQQIAHRLQAFHVFALTQADYQLNSTTSGDKNVVTMFWCNTLGGSLFPNDILPDQDSSDYIPKNVSLFSGFMPALSACSLIPHRIFGTRMEFSAWISVARISQADHRYQIEWEVDSLDTSSLSWDSQRLCGECKLQLAGSKRSLN
ncbi:unnamed protein product [Trichobilharzia regenti]|nr:unnamed protein product [Trichobilharzia regenti]